MIPAGILNRKITLQSEETIRDKNGQPSKAFTTVRSCWAAVTNATSKEVYAASGFATQISHMVTIRYDASALAIAGMRVLYGTGTFRVQAVTDPNEAHEVQQLMCLKEVESA